MNIWNKVLVGLILVMALPFCYFAAKTLHARQKAGDAIVKHEKELASLASDQERLLNGPDSGIKQLVAEVYPYTTRRGRVWINVSPKRFDAATGLVSVQTEMAPPKNAPGGLQLYLFQNSVAAQEKVAALDPSYLGEFTIANVGDAGKTWQLTPVRPLTPDRAARIQPVRGTWTIYEVMPTPNPELVARSQAAATSEAAPEASKTPEPPKKFDSAAAVQDHVGKLFQFEWFFNDAYRKRTVLAELIAAGEADAKSLTDSVALTEQANVAAEKQIANAKTDLAAKEAARDVVQAHQKAVEAKLAGVSDTVERLLKLNRQLAAEIARLQLEATRRIDERVRGVVQTAAVR
jgi:hypothetical protein